jgi:hypothetical protein
MTDRLKDLTLAMLLFPTLLNLIGGGVIGIFIYYTNFTILTLLY